MGKHEEKGKEIFEGKFPDGSQEKTKCKSIHYSNQSLREIVNRSFQSFSSLAMKEKKTYMIEPQAMGLDQSEMRYVIAELLTFCCFPKIEKL